MQDRAHWALTSEIPGSREDSGPERMITNHRSNELAANKLRSYRQIFAGSQLRQASERGGTVKRHQSRSRNNHGGHLQMKEGIPGIEEGHADKEENARDYIDDKTGDSPG